MRVRPSPAALRSFGRVAILTVIGGLAAACSSDSTRLGENPFSNPFEGRSSSHIDQQPTGSIGNTHPLPPASVTSSPLPAPQSVPVRPRPIAAAQPGTSAPTYLGNAANWSAEGGTPVVLGQGETVLTLANRYGVPPQAVLQANGLRSASDAQPGQRLVIPVYRAAAAAPAAQPLPPRPVAPVPHFTAPTKQEAARSARAHIAEKPVAKAVATRQEAKQIAKPVVAQAKVEPKHAVKPEAKVAAVAPAPVKKVEVAAVPAKRVEPAPAPQQVAARPDVETTASLPSASEAPSADFRWPARGRVISAYKRGGNEGINIALPEGTAVRAADAGVVAYAGNELKGYGNLVLVRHANGYVTAYAHNGDLTVKRGQTVSRGQEIARSGATGNVSSPQLHFELRKGATPVDPMPYLN